MDNILSKIVFNQDGLIPVIAQQYDTGMVLTLAWMNREALTKTIAENRMWYWSRSRKQLWQKGETSGQVQQLKQLILDCDLDAVLALVDQEGVACHTGRKSCFFNSIEGGPIEGVKIKINQRQIVPPEKLYGEQ